jgi:hypothetical protein
LEEVKLVPNAEMSIVSAKKLLGVVMENHTSLVVPAQVLAGPPPVALNKELLIVAPPVQVVPGTKGAVPAWEQLSFVGTWENAFNETKKSKHSNAVLAVEFIVLDFCLKIIQ